MKCLFKIIINETTNQPNKQNKITHKKNYERIYLIMITKINKIK